VGPAWLHAFLAAGLLTLAGTPVLRRIAFATGFVDHPVAAHKSHSKATPYLGGYGLIAAVLVGLLFTAKLTPLVAVIALGGSLIGCLGLFDDDRSTGALFRFALEAGVACVALAAGLRVHATDIVGIDAVLTVVWIVGVTNSVNLLDNMDGSAAGISAAAASAIFAIAVLGEQPATAVAAAGLVGACVGFLVHNKRPASIFMGDTGSLFLGFVLSVTALDMSPALSPPTSFAVPLMLLALPVLDTATVTVCRLRRGRSVALGGKDHLSHRLVKRGLSPGIAVGVLIGAEAVVGVLAVLAGRDVLPLSVAATATATVICMVVWATIGAEVYEESVIGLPRRLRLALLAGAGGIMLVATPSLVALGRAYAPGTAGARSTRLGLEALQSGDATGAVVLFDKASRDLTKADRVLGGRVNSLSLALPMLRANLATTRAVVAAGLQVAGTGSRLSSVVAAPDLPLGPGADVPGQVARLAPALDASAAALERSVRGLAGYDRPYLWPSLGDTVRQLRASLTAGASRARAAADLARVAPGLLGDPSPRRYFLAIQDNTELRGSGGVIHFFGEMETQDGRLRLTHFGPIDQLNQPGVSRRLQLPELLDRYPEFDVANTWQNVNVSPDFAVTGQAVAELYPQSGGGPIDGVIAVDLPGLAALLRLSGPVAAEGWPTPLSGANLVKALTVDSTALFPDPAQRQLSIGRAAEAAVRAFVAADLGTPARLARALGPAVDEGHLLLYATRPPEEQILGTLGVTGTGHRDADALLVVNQNLTGTGVDSFLRREVSYALDINPGRNSANVTGHLTVTMHNDAPAVAQAEPGAGAHAGTALAGGNKTYVSIHTPLSLTASRLDGSPTTVGSAMELGRNAYSTTVDMPSSQSRTLGLDLMGRMTQSTDGWFRLDVLHQPSLGTDAVEVSVSVPSGWRIVEGRGVDIIGARRATAALRSQSSSQIAIRVERTPWARLWTDDGG
jgi:UDP-GlcNAc:undecaprenyl-phosphate GlcNAc-1-phosphate transferase